MNLKFKMSKKLTAVVEFVNDTTAIFSDECSPHATQTLRILTNDAGFEDLLEDAKELAIQLAAPTRFKPVIFLIKGKHTDTQELEPAEAEELDNPFRF